MTSERNSSEGRPPPPSRRSPPRPSCPARKHTSSPSPEIKAKQHRVVPSRGGDSTISGITDSGELSPPNLKFIELAHNNGNTPSLDAQEEDTSSLQVPSLDDDDHNNNNGQEASQASNSKMRLAEILNANPVEEEAETAIMQVIEEEGLVEPSSTEQILPLVPDEIVEAATLEQDDEEERQRQVPTRRIFGMNRTLTKLRVLAEELEEVHAEAGELVAPAAVAAEGEAEEEKQQETRKLLATPDVVYEDCQVLFGSTLEKKEADCDLEAGEGEGYAALKKSTKITKMTRKVRTGKAQMDHLAEYFATQRVRMRKYLLPFLVLIVLLLGFAALLYYAMGNPLLANSTATVSFLLVLIARHLILWSLAWVTELFVIGYLSLQTKVTVRILGVMGSLALVQSKGFPFQTFAWGIYSFFLLSGPSHFSYHWLHYQDAIELFNEKNSGGEILEDGFYMMILACAIIFGALVTAKRVWWGLRVGRITYRRFGRRYTRLVEEMVLVSEVGNLSSRQGAEVEAISPRLSNIDYEIEEASQGSSNVKSLKTITHERRAEYIGTKLDLSQKSILSELLGDWEEPEEANGHQDTFSIRELLEFRQALALLDSGFPFSLSFGPCDSRERCVESSQRVYERLMLATPQKDKLQFETIAFIAVNDNGAFDQKKLKSLIRLFRPDREGEMTLLDFVKSVDSVYKELRMFRASVRNAMQVENAVEQAMNFIFYAVLFLVFISLVGKDPIAFIMSVSGVLVGFAFMIGGASADYFRGLLLILLRRPYDVGDRIAIAGVGDSAPAGGSSTWFVENVDLYTTTVRFATTNEVATLSNGSLANSRIINGKRSPKAVRFVHMKFGTDVPYNKIQLFKLSVEKFVKARPREWLAFSGFRAIDVRPELNYIEYLVVLQHRESWQNIGPILNSTAEVTAFCLELSKKLGMEYSAPPMPVNLSMKPPSRGDPAADGSASIDIAPLPDETRLPANVEELAAMFDDGDEN